MNYGWFIPVIVAASFSLTWALRRYALSRSLMDIPNARSSHSVPTPRGGGVAIVLAFTLALLMLWLARLMPSQAFLGIAGAGTLIAVIGFMDDHGHIAARWRLLGHFAASIWLLFWLGGLPVIEFFGYPFDLGWFGHVLATFYLVWLLNLYNFMDGIDGIASVEAICVCLGACLLYWVSNAADLIWAPLLLAIAVAGFLFWNFPPAKIFMGDAGSGFLGIVLGGLSLQAAWVSADLLWGWLILLGVFIVDATFTLFRRLLRGDKVYEAHRSHAYQFASRRFGSHLTVTAVVGAINLLWLLPIAVGITRFGLNAGAGLILAYAPLIALAIKYHAGELETPPVKN
ncbi:UDP-N-acetylmuramyl pentapeptide phosphotransferase/UDP-N-acetylglucosamine-1-phosphate transferase [Pseudomonas sp. GM78]|uniref:MraY family glycosyltransferase n=1 Tax=Pseudomonas sp. GM78 TaxID=1144337 RepID=UPI000270A2C9|nr:glycosyltransferase family 4 protein [Pseudomonas sp. GM78]EJN18786.1 UDP-N-acetylmuramyl pentapeptide phosphotransferase/UDP-N-acetylglucosamine-1-phosphate transferase [Pseudomonas sp. GM78]